MIPVLVLGVLLVVAIGIGAAVVLATRSKQAYVSANQVVPGVATKAPESWAGSHHLEARLHRRLRDAMTALRANQAFDHDGALLDLRVELEHQAVALDDRLVVIAALPAEHRHEHLEKAAESVATIEATVAVLAGREADRAQVALQAALDRAREHTDLLDQIQAELDQLEQGGPAAPEEGTPGPA